MSSNRRKLILMLLSRPQLTLVLLARFGPGVFGMYLREVRYYLGRAPWSRKSYTS